MNAQQTDNIYVYKPNALVLCILNLYKTNQNFVQMN